MYKRQISLLVKPYEICTFENARALLLSSVPQDYRVPQAIEAKMVGRERFELSKMDSINWEGFEAWVRKTHHKGSDSILNTVRYAKKYCEVLFNPNKTSELLTFTKSKRRLVMASLSNLSRYLGVYDQWKEITRNFGLKYESRTGLEAIVDILNSDLEGTKEWLREAIPKLPKHHATVLIFNALTGVRPSEGCLSCELISDLSDKGRLNDYLDRKLMMLQHFKFKDLFLRKSKNCYISFINESLLELVLKNRPKITYSGLASALNKRGFNNPLNKLRKLYSTLLREHLPTEAIDLLQGRVSQSIFVRYYYNPVFKQLREKTINAIKPLQDELLTLTQ